MNPIIDSRLHVSKSIHANDTIEKKKKFCNILPIKIKSNHRTIYGCVYRLMARMFDLKHQNICSKKQRNFLIKNHIHIAEYSRGIREIHGNHFVPWTRLHFLIIFISFLSGFVIDSENLLMKCSKHVNGSKLLKSLLIPSKLIIVLMKITSFFDSYIAFKN